MRDAFNFYVHRLRNADKVTVIYQIIIIALILYNFRKIDHTLELLAFNLCLIILLILLPGFKSHPLINWFKVWNPVIIIVLNFSELHYLVHPVNPNDIDKLLIDIDFAVFGVHPTVWMEQLTFPALTEYLQIIYSVFYFLPLILAVKLKRSGEATDFDYFVFIMVYGFYASYIGYFLFPAIGPRFTLDSLQSFPLSGLGITEYIRVTLDTLENSQRDAFPSGHTAMTLLTMFYAARFYRKYFYILLIIGTSLIFSTVYLRYHYVVDVVAGFILAFWVIASGPFIYRLLCPNDKQAVPEET